METHQVNKKLNKLHVNFVNLTNQNKINIEYHLDEHKHNAYNADYEWLKYYFKEEDLIQIVLQDERVKSLIALQAIYYLSLFKRLYLSKNMMSNKVSDIP